MSAETVVRTYLDAFFSGQPDWDRIRVMLTDDFRFNGPLMTARSADDFIGQLKGMGPMNMQGEVHDVIAADDLVAAHYDFLMPDVPVPASEWYTIRDGKIADMRLFCDPRPFLAAFNG